MGMCSIAIRALLLAVLLLPLAGRAEDLKVGVVDSRRAMVSSKEGRAADKVMADLFEKKKKKIEPLDEELKRRKEEFDSQRFVLSKEALEERRLDLMKRQRDLERAMSEAQEELEIEQRKLMQPLVKHTDEVLTKLGKEKKFTVILEKSSPGVLYFKDSLDITDLVIQRLDED